MNIRKKERIFFFTHAITILSLFTYSVCDKKVKKNRKNNGISSGNLKSVWVTVIQCVGRGLINTIHNVKKRKCCLCI